MAVRSVYQPEPDLVGGTLAVIGEEHAHLRVSRAQPAEAVEVFDGAGRVWGAEVIVVGAKSTRLRILTERREPPPGAEIILAQALIKNRAFEWMLEKAVEIGVTRIIPFRATRSNVSGDRRSRWDRIVVEAAKQSKRYHLPRLDPVTSIEGVLSVHALSKIVFALETEGSVESALHGAPVVYMIGPEGGWTAEELDVARLADYRPVRLGAHIMRSETAAVVGGGLIAHYLGAF